ncbi:hypothetical protein [Burkholderia pseudomallei]|uniref:hypothetical protein n=1 Tax=Burkholderia pseudomallei TaxID=28450 RepID=UPI001038612F|nr:hypothetical protein [Burkholderia pseudomallei]
MTTENNRADALTETLKEEMDRLHREFSAMSPLKQRMWLMQHAAASPVEQLAAAPIPEDCDVRNILLDVVPGEDGEGQEVYARNVADVERLLSEMGEKLDAAKQPAPSPADERAAFVERVMGMFEAWPNGKPGPTDEPESHYRFGYNTALEDVLTALDVGSPTRRAASANERDALRWQILAEAIEGSLGNAELSYWIGALDQCIDKAAIAKDFLKPFLAAPYLADMMQRRVRSDGEKS